VGPHGKKKQNGADEENEKVVLGRKKSGNKDQTGQQGKKRVRAEGLEKKKSFKKKGQKTGRKHNQMRGLTRK